MAEFFIQCPKCERYTKAKTGLFARKNIACPCGHTINLRTDRYTSRQCPNCGNEVVFDQAAGDKARCPVCEHPLNRVSDVDKTKEFPCAQCGVTLHIAGNAKTYKCPVCDHVNDVAERIKMEQIKHDGLASSIKYEGDNDTIAWKHPIEDFNYGSQLIVHESQEAIFFRDGQALDLFGAGRYTLETHQLPMLERLYRLPTDTDGTFHSEVYFVNTATIMGIKWGTDTKVRFFDPMTGMHLELGASGEFNIRVANARKFLLKIVGTTGGFRKDQVMGGARTPDGGVSKGMFRALVMAQVKSHLAAAIRENSISIFEIDERLMELSDALREKINLRLDEYGLEIADFYVSRVLTPDDDKNFNRAREQFASQYLDVREREIRREIERAQGEADKVKAAAEAEVLKIQSAAKAEAYRMQAAAEAEEMRMKGYTYQQETARQVGLGMTDAVGKMGGEGGGMAGGMGELATLGVMMGSLGTVAGMTRETLTPLAAAATQAAQPAAAPAAEAGWECPECGAKGNLRRFCGECGARKPEAPAGWDCPECGNKGITSRFCPECGFKKPEAPAAWDCPECGNKGITGKFCGECGCRKP